MLLVRFSAATGHKKSKLQGGFWGVEMQIGTSGSESADMEGTSEGYGGLRRAYVEHEKLMHNLVRSSTRNFTANSCPRMWK